MTIRRFPFALISAFVLSAALGAPDGVAAAEEETLLDYVLEACADDIETYCDQVTPGGGRVALCVAAHEDKISTDCTVAIYNASAVIQAIADEIAYLAESCAEDIDTFCADTPVGDGRIINCLSEHMDEASETCTTAISEASE
jgi:Golgi apparatus protein 1